MQIPHLTIGDLTAPLPIVQGGMGVGISLFNLAAAVAKAGGIGVISATEIGFNFPNYQKDKLKTNLQALQYHIQQARKIAPQGILGVNIMVAANNYLQLTQTAIEAGIDIIFSGAGLPLNLPKIAAGSKTLLAPIVSSARGAALICKHWTRKSNYLPDAIVIEGPLAGGHLGFKLDELAHNPPQLVDLVQKVRLAIQPFEDQYNKTIPLIAGGGIVHGSQIAKLLQAGAQGVQIGTLFALTEECDASRAWKEELLQAKKEDIIIIKSPVGLPGRAVNNAFLKRVNQKKEAFRCNINCLKSCQPATAPYCIAQALINAQKGNLDAGFAFTGANVDQINTLSTVPEVMSQLLEGYQAAIQKPVFLK